MRISFEDDERPVLIERFGLADDASDEDIAAAMTGVLLNAEEGEQQQQQEGEQQEEQQEEQQQEDDGATSEDGVLIDLAAYNALNQRANLAARLQEEDRVNTRDNLIEAAIHDGKFPPSRRQHYLDRYDSDPESTTTLIGRLLPGTVPVEERGREVNDEEVEDQSSYPTEWVPEVAAKRADAAKKGEGGGKRQRRNRVTTEEG